MKIADAVSQAVTDGCGDYWKVYLDLRGAQCKAHFLNSQSTEDREYAEMQLLRSAGRGYTKLQAMLDSY